MTEFFLRRPSPQSFLSPRDCAVLTGEHMIVMRTLVTGLIVAMLLGGCAASVGKHFVRPEPKLLVLGKTTFSEIWPTFGNPWEEKTKTINEKIVQTKSYVHAAYRLPAMAIRTMEFHFFDNVLVGYEFVSTFDEDHTNFDETKVTLLKRGETSLAKVRDLLGEPAGVETYPILKQPADKALIYSYGQFFTASGDKQEKRLTVSFGSDGVVSDIELVSAKRVRSQIR